MAYKQLEYLIKEKQADCSLLDVKGNSPLHYLCCNSNLAIDDAKQMAKLKEKGEEDPASVVEKAALLLIDNGCQVNRNWPCVFVSFCAFCPSSSIRSMWRSARAIELT